MQKTQPYVSRWMESAMVKVGPFARGGKNRVLTKAADHDFEAQAWKGRHPLVELVTSAYQTGVKLTKEAMQGVETHLQRWSSLEKWFVDIPSSLPAEIQQESRSSLQEKSTSQKRPRGRPPTRPLPDPTQPKRPRGRPRKPVLAESITPIATPG